MKNRRLETYSQLSNLQDIEQEKIRLKRLIQKQEVIVEADWDDVYEFWSFIPKGAQLIKQFAIKIPKTLEFLKIGMDFLRKFK